MIFNRWGVKVWEKDNYMSSGSDRFKGYSNNNRDINNNKLLPAGTYYYIIEINDGISINGYLYIYHDYK